MVNAVRESQILLKKPYELTTGSFCITVIEATDCDNFLFGLGTSEKRYFFIRS